jgi:hypothetical protein
MIKLEFEVAEVNAILEALGQRPFVAVASVIQKIQQQAAPQVQAQAEAPAEAE